jgi:GlpG protein
VVLNGDWTLREIGSIAREQDARTLADHLLTLNITTKLEPKGGGWAVWVHREDRVPEARAVLAEFEKDPSDPRFRGSVKTAKEIRKQLKQEEKAYRKRVRDLRDRWEGAMYLRAPLAFALIVFSVVVTVLMHFSYSTVFYLSFSERFFTAFGALDRDTGFEAIKRGEVWRLITPIFLHFGIFHLFFNMTAMRYLGERVETRKGTWRFALICLVAAIGGNVGQFYKSGGAFGGMSGVVFALAGYLWIKGHTDPADGLFLSERSVNWMLGWFLLGIIAPLTVGNDQVPRGFPYNMANVAHGVGLGVGMVFGLLRF